MLRRLKDSIILSCLILGLLPFLSGCSWKSNNRPNVLVIMVEDLGFNAFSCSDSSVSVGESGFQAFCDEAVRFTHAYAPSTMSQATIASILTAKYPFEHGLRHNGHQFLSGKEVTIAEKALANRFRTAFFSGGAPIWRRSGLNQGFEVFDDSVNIETRKFYRSASEVFKLFLDWQEGEVGKGRYASFLFLSDLQLIDAPTTNELGELRESSFRSQVEEVDESLAVLVREMKRRRIWDTTDIFLVGLQGRPEDTRALELAPVNLFSESTRSTLMVKPARKKNREGPFNWKIDANVSLVDVGTTLLDLIGETRTEVVDASGESSKQALSYSLLGAILGPRADWPVGRYVISESAWSEWHFAGEIRAALRQGSYLYIFDETPRLYNTLTDTFETIPLPATDRKATDLRIEFSDYLGGLSFEPWIAPERRAIEKIQLAQVLWRDREIRPEVIERLQKLSKKYEDDEQLKGWRATFALKRSEWAKLKEAAGKKNDRPLWSYVASRNLSEKTTLPTDPCLEFLPEAGRSKKVSKSCLVEGMQELVTWADESSPEAVRTKAMESFLRIYQSRLIADRVAAQNLAIAMSWDAVEIDDPEPLELYLALPELRKQRAMVRSRLKI